MREPAGTPRSAPTPLRAPSSSSSISSKAAVSSAWTLGGRSSAAAPVRGAGAGSGSGGSFGRRARSSGARTLLSASRSS